MPVSVKILVGSQYSYACIKLPGKSLDVALSAGHSAPASLNESAKELRMKSVEYLERARIMEAAATILQDKSSGGIGEMPQLPIINSGDWLLSNKVVEYVDFDKQLIDFEDDGNTSIDMRLTFDIEAHSAYIVTLRHNDDGETRNLGPQINISWDEALRMIGDLAVHVPS